MRTVTRAIAGTLLGIVIVLGVLSAAWNFALKGTPLEDMIGTGVANAALDASGIKGQIDSTLRENVSAIASATGMSESQVTSAIDQLNIESWSVTTLPSDARSTPPTKEQAQRSPPMPTPHTSRLTPWAKSLRSPFPKAPNLTSRSLPTYSCE